MNLEAIRAEVSRFNLPLAADVSINPATDRGVFVSVKTKKDAVGKRTPSGKLLSEVRKAIEALGARADFLLVDETSNEIEDGVRASLLSSFPDVVRNSYVSIVTEVANVWIEKKREPTDIEKEQLSNHISTYAHLFKLRDATLNIMSDFSIATASEVLKVIRKLSPADCESVSAELQKRGHSVPSLSWVNHKFDLLRKQGLVVRIPERRYALTHRALRDLGTVKSKASPDISHLLALARQGE